MMAEYVRLMYDKTPPDKSGGRYVPSIRLKGGEKYQPP